MRRERVRGCGRLVGGAPGAQAAARSRGWKLCSPAAPRIGGMAIAGDDALWRMDPARSSGADLDEELENDGVSDALSLPRLL